MYEASIDPTEKYVVYNRKTWKCMKARNGHTVFTKSVAKRVLTNAAKKDKDFDASLWKLDTYKQYRADEPEVESVNILSGKKVMIKASEEGTCTDPGTERYHSM